MMVHKLILACAIAAIGMQVSSARGQGQDRLTSVNQLGLWVGEWQGSGWSVNGSGERIEFNLTESVSEKAGRTVLLVEGRGVRADGAGRGKITHDGLVLVYRDASGRYRWHGHEAATGFADIELTMIENGMEWRLGAGTKSAVVRFTILLDAKQWHEVGEASDDGVTWNRFMEMTLRRVRPGAQSGARTRSTRENSAAKSDPVTHLPN
jgi:hypothetical protein